MIIPVIRILVQTHSKMSCTSERFQFPSPLDKEDLTLIQSGHAVFFETFMRVAKQSFKIPLSYLTGRCSVLGTLLNPLV